MASIERLRAIEILDSRGEPTLEVTALLSDGTQGVASVPSGASTGTYEAYELRDGDTTRYQGKGVLRAITNVSGDLNDALRGVDTSDQGRVDALMLECDGTANKERLGANAILGVSLAVARATASSLRRPLYQHLRTLAGISRSTYTLPIPLVNVINGGKHASTNLDIQEFWVIPDLRQGFARDLRAASEIFHSLGQLFQEQKMDTDLGNEGGYAPDFQSHQHALDSVRQAIERAGYIPGTSVWMGMDVGATVFFDPQRQRYDLPLDTMQYTADEFADLMMGLISSYPLRALEDVFAEEDWTAWQSFTRRAKEKYPNLAIIGDDLFVTNVQRLEKGIALGAANAILIKPNQIGTLSETIACINRAHEKGYATAISHRSGETTDTFIADLSVAVDSEYIKTGSTARGERLAKYNRLLEIEQELHDL